MRIALSLQAVIITPDLSSSGSRSYRKTATHRFHGRNTNQCNDGRVKGISLMQTRRIGSLLLTRPVVASVIAGATRPEQVKANVAATHWSLSAEDLAEIDRIV